jgi:hypothetical protein
MSERRTAAQSCEQLQAQADERRLEVIFEKILQQHAAEDNEYYLANLEEAPASAAIPVEGKRPAPNGALMGEKLDQEGHKGLDRHTP